MPNQRWVTRVGRVLLRLRRSGRTREFHAAAILAALGAASTLVLPAGSAVAFDTGPHAGITIDALTRAGFNRNAADVVQVENWLTDYYTSSPTIGGAAKCDLEKLHFDDVFSSADVANYWTTLAANTKAAAKKAEADNDTPMVLQSMRLAKSTLQMTLATQSIHIIPMGREAL